MPKHVSISAMGKDRPGIVANFSKVLFQVGCNLEETSMLLLRGEFAMILIVALPETTSMQSFISNTEITSFLFNINVISPPLILFVYCSEYNDLQ